MEQKAVLDSMWGKQRTWSNQPDTCPDASRREGEEPFYEIIRSAVVATFPHSIAKYKKRETNKQDRSYHFDFLKVLFLTIGALVR